MAFLEKHEVLDLVSSASVPSGKNVIGTKGVFKVNANHTLKRTSRDSGLRTRAGSRPQLHLRSRKPYPEHPYDTFHCCTQRLGVLQLNAQTTFLNASVQEEVDVKTPPGYKSVDVATRLSHVMKLKSSIYGLRQCPRK